MKSLALVLVLLATVAAGRSGSPARNSTTLKASSPVEASAPLTIVRDGRQALITFAGGIQSAGSLAGPWTTVSDAVSPLRQDLADAQMFYRSRSADGGGIFSDSSVVRWTLTGPLQTHFNLAFAGSPDGFFPPVRLKPYFNGALKSGALEVPISLRVRGNSSLQECPFPKLKFKIAKTDRAGTPFADAREIKIGTHCAEGGRGNIGRLRDERATYREALAYETMAVLGFAGPRVRRARIDFHDTSPTNAGVEGGWQLERNAVILDDIEVVAERLGGRALSDTELQALPPGAIKGQVLVDIQFLHALLGNWDYSLPLEGGGYQNTDVVELPDKTLLPVAGDFDLASFVTEEVRSSAPRDFRPELPAVEREALFVLGQLRGRVGGQSFQAASARFLARRAAMELQVNCAVVDEPGRTNARRHLAAFFAALMAPQ